MNSVTFFMHTLYVSTHTNFIMLIILYNILCIYWNTLFCLWIYLKCRDFMMSSVYFYNVGLGFLNSGETYFIPFNGR